ncbi:LysR family transcriptional regulator [Nocardioides mangrovicus]|uniref:LysR family transcriptional regulator n=1 Tax=Nocardioides mangrovicus TaxID=2478913 RepID=A0A3L8P284_9ACTN|nr:LysR family transcriptional regulator [Nocardioides mangrovicus]RLV49496.1 LysR family transcriptional regulator [Nocardioides mangrovicus]
MQTLDPRRLAVLLAVHRYGGVLAAADETDVTASAVSQQISKLESEVGVAVLDRRPGGAVLTDAGRVLVETAERIEAELTDARRAMATLLDEVTGTVAVGGFQSVIQAVLVPLATDLADRLPGLRVVIQDIDPEEGMRSLRDGTLDLLLLEADSPVGRSTPRGMRDLTVLEDPWLLALPQGLPAPTSLEDLVHQTWLGVDPTAAAHSATERVMSLLPHRPDVEHQHSNSDVAISMVGGGLGIALLPSLALRGAIRHDGVQAVSLPGLGARQLVARRRHTRAAPRREVIAVLDEIVAAAGSLEPLDALE